MNKWKSYLRKSLKVVVWIIASFLIAFSVMALLIQIPSIQTKIVGYATTFISGKTHTKVEIEKIGISFPKSVVIERLFLDDLQKDTLLSADRAIVNISLFDLFYNKITINSCEIEEATINFHSSKTGPLFNYKFLFDAFRDTTNKVKPDTASVSKWTFTLDKVALKNVRFVYNDEFSGLKVSTVLKNLNLTIEKLEFDQPLYQFGNLFVEGLTLTILRLPSPKLNKNGAVTILPTFGVNQLQISNSKINYTDSVGCLSVVADIDQLVLGGASIGLQKNLLSSGDLNLSKSKIQYHTFSPEFQAGKDNAVPVSESGNDWKINLRHIVLNDNTISYKAGNKQPLKGVFDPNDLEFSSLTLDATDFYYSTDLTNVSVTKFSATDRNGFAIESFEVGFSMASNSITVKKLAAKTKDSKIWADFSIQYSSLNALMDSLQFSDIDIDLKNLQMVNSDMLYFKPNLSKISFFKNSRNETTISGKITGLTNNLTGIGLSIKTLAGTIIKTDFNIKGLPNVKTAFYNFPNLNITSVRKDIELMADTLIPKSIEVPEKINLKAAFKGQMKSFESTATLSSSSGNANLVASFDPAENFILKLGIERMDLGRLLKDTVLFGPVSLTSEATGRGLDPKTVKSNIKTYISNLYIKNHIYRNLALDATVNSGEVGLKITGNDEDAVFGFDGFADMNAKQERYKFKLDVKGADLQKLGLSKNDLRLAFVAAADFRGKIADQLIGSAEITNVVMSQDRKTEVIDSFLTASLNQPDNIKKNKSNALIDLNYSGNVSAIALPEVIRQFVTNYFPFSSQNPVILTNGPANFSFDLRLNNHPILSNILLPQLKEFDPVIIHGSFDSPKNNLKLDCTFKKIVYGTTEINDFAIVVNSDKTTLNYKISSSAISNAQINLGNFSIDGKLEGNQIFANVAFTDDKVRKLLIRSRIASVNGNYRLTFDPNEFIMMDNRWAISPDHFIEIGKQGFRIHHLFLEHAGSLMNFASVHDQFNDDLNIGIQNFKLDDLSHIVEKGVSLVKGNMDGNILLKRVANSFGIISDVKVNNLVVYDVPVGNLSLKAVRSEGDQFNIDLKLSGSDNNLTSNGYYIPGGGDHSIKILTDIQSLSLKTVQAFSMGQITEADGTLTGNLLAEGRAGAPEISGELVFNNAFLKPSYLNNRLELKHETLQFKKDGIYFNSFTMLDATHNKAILDGSLKMKEFSDFVLDLHVTTKDFLLFNTLAGDKKDFFGRMVVDSKVDVSGPISLPVVVAKVKMKKGSNFTFAVPEDKLTTDRGENVVEFDNSLKINSIVSNIGKGAGETTGITGFDLSSIIEIDKEATLRLLMDPASTDSLVVKGEAALSFTMDRSGKMSLTGAYNLNDGSYLVSLESVIKRKFAIKQGSTIIWNGDPLDATISIDAVYSVRASPYDLVADQISGKSDVDQGGYKQRYPFQVLLKLRGEILHPEIGFEIQLLPEDKGILGGAVNQKLIQLDSDPSALNKQVFALLVLGRFVQENPFQSESGGTSVLIRSTVGKFLSAQLNKLSSQLIPGMELNFDVQSYDDYQTGKAQGRTQVEIGLKKQLFNERLSVQLGGAIDVEGARAQQNSVSDITSDVTLEYKLTKDGRLRMKGFRHNLYEGAIDGQLVETGIGLVFVRDFNQWGKLLKTQKSRMDTTKTQIKNDTIISK